MKECTTCKTSKPLSEFYSRSKKYRKGDLAASTFNECKSCHAIRSNENRKQPGRRAKISEQRKEWRKNNPEWKRILDRKNNLYRGFGITPEQYQAILEMQNGVCAICGKPETAKLRGIIKNLAVDHCHTTGKIRGLLCSCCNTAIGLLQDDEEVVSLALNYLFNPIKYPPEIFPN